MTLGDVIAKYRAQHKISMDKFAELSGISKGYISMLERNQTHRGDEPSPSFDMYKSVAKAIGIDVDELIRMVEGNISLVPPIPSNAIPVPRMRKIPILGSIRAGMPILAEENIEGYGFADVPEHNDYFYLRVNGDSMMNARIHEGDLVLIRQQPCADEGDIVACLVNGDEATLKRFYRQKDMIILKPENPAYSPLVVPCKDFENGEACILGVVVKVEFEP